MFMSNKIPVIAAPASAFPSAGTASRMAAAPDMKTLLEPGHCPNFMLATEVDAVKQESAGVPAIKSILKPTAARPEGCGSLKPKLYRVRIQEGS